MERFRLPNAAVLARLFTDMLDCPVTVKRMGEAALRGKRLGVGSAERKAQDSTPSSGTPASAFPNTWGAAYVVPDGRLAALCIFDLAAAAGLGGALSMMPPESTELSLRNAELDELLEENFREVCNMLTPLFARPGIAISLKDVRPLPAASPWIHGSPPSGQRLDLEVTVEGYGQGSLGLWAA
ncbi:MAG: hypothetical protein QF599_09885 [Planctomycetota bacterium]|jgi:hypothetical protein|nr:hypothetical protein [Planctomycetota bacterium]MDP6370709.1 hypothetical protein [Planctomycetota bacterium]MDP6519674.1 hypothetical protein [Planctomycetota bacterium]MDP6956275.1 hypothetical protein [Planctomycetota bacterium]